MSAFRGVHPPQITKGSCWEGWGTLKEKLKYKFIIKHDGS